MPSTRKKTTKAGEVFYEISVSRGRGRSRLTRRWYPPEGWSQKAIDRELAAVAAEFERQSDAGEIVSRSEDAREPPWRLRKPPKSSPCANMGKRYSCRPKPSQ